MVLTDSMQLQDCGQGVTRHFRQASSQHRRILRMLENIGPGEVDDSDSDGGEATAGVGGATGSNAGGSGSDGGVVDDSGGGGNGNIGAAFARAGSAIQGIQYESDDVVQWSAS